MKKLIILTALLFVLSFSVFTFAEEPLTRIRIVNLSALGVEKELLDEELVRLADIEISENPEIFPNVADFVIKVDEKVIKYIPDTSISVGSLTFSGSMGEFELLEFISLMNYEKVGKFDIAILIGNHADGNFATAAGSLNDGIEVERLSRHHVVLGRFQVELGSLRVE